MTLARYRETKAVDEIKQVDARGLSCPQPVLLVRNKLQELGSGEAKTVVDTMTQVENCTRTAESLGWSTTCEEKDASFELTFRK